MEGQPLNLAALKQIGKHKISQEPLDATQVEWPLFQKYQSILTFPIETFQIQNGHSREKMATQPQATGFKMAAIESKWSLDSRLNRSAIGMMIKIEMAINPNSMATGSSRFPLGINEIEMATTQNATATRLTQMDTRRKPQNSK